MTRKSFAKVFGEGADQICAILDANEDNDPSIKVNFWPKNEDIGLCAYAITFSNTPKGWEQAHAALDKMDEALACEGVEIMTKSMPELFDGEGQDDE